MIGDEILVKGRLGGWVWIFITSINIFWQDNQANKRELRVRIQKDTGEMVIRIDKIINGMGDMYVSKIL